MKSLIPAARMLLVLTILTGVIYPVVVTGIAQVAYPAEAGGSLLTVGDTVVGSALIAQFADDPRYFHPRPSAVNWMQSDSPELLSSGATNYGPASAELAEAAAGRAADFREANGLASNAEVPAEMLFASGSGLDPHISPEAAHLQAPRVAEARGLPTGEVARLVDQHTESRQFGFLGEPRVNVLLLNLALDRLRTDN